MLGPTCKCTVRCILLHGKSPFTAAVRRCANFCRAISPRNLSIVIVVVYILVLFMAENSGNSPRKCAACLLCDADEIPSSALYLNSEDE